jgi:murein DD-endopeptidase MepM/ murein hydrolase activator NlpD
MSITLLLLLLATMALVQGVPVLAPSSPSCPWVSPVDAPVVDPFRPPAGPYGPGNRGLEYGAEPGAVVTAVADGQVTFAGQVGGRRFVVITHQSGLRSTYGPLDRVDVVRGQVVARGQPIATASSGLHLTARRGDRYLDPQPLLDGVCGTPRLVPTDTAAQSPAWAARSSTLVPARVR